MLVYQTMQTPNYELLLVHKRKGCLDALGAAIKGLRRKIKVHRSGRLVKGFLIILK